MKKLNDLWLKFKKWSEVNFLGYLIVSIVKVICIFILFILLYYLLFIIGPFKDESSSSVSDSTVNNNCNVAGINLHGSLVTYIPLHSENDSSSDFNYDTVSSENIVQAISQANDNENIKAIILEINSSGGSPVASEEIAEAVKNSGKPVVGLIRQIGASGAYWAVSTADKIFASKNSDIGSIGVTSSYLSNVRKNNKDGYTYEQLSAGKFKDSGSVDKPLTKEEKVLFMRDINIIYQNFIEAVSQNRNIPIEKVKNFSDGSTFLGEKAKEFGLIDEIGSLPEVESYIQETTGVKPEICWQ